MILDIDHLAISCTIDEKINNFINLGYHKKFIANKIKNLEIKSKFLDNPPKHHSLALLTSKHSIGIELVDHGYTKETNEYPLIPLMTNLPKNTFIDKNQNFGNFGSICTLNDFAFPIIHNTDETGLFQFNNLLIKTTNLEDSIQFWKTFGFTILSHDKTFTTLEFCSILTSKKYIFTILEDPPVSDTLDLEGPNCIAFFSNSIEDEKTHFENSGYYVSQIDSLVVNNQKLNMFFVEDKSGIIVEILSLA